MFLPQHADMIITDNLFGQMMVISIWQHMGAVIYTTMTNDVTQLQDFRCVYMYVGLISYVELISYNVLHVTYPVIYFIK